MKLTTAAVASAAAIYLVFCVYYSAKVMYTAATAPAPLVSHRSIRPAGASSADAALVLAADSAVAAAASGSFVSAASISQAISANPVADAAATASWCARMQREGDAIARSFDGEMKRRALRSRWAA